MTRRRFIGHTLATATLAAALPRSTRAQTGAPPTTQALDFTSRKLFDDFDLAWNHGNGNADKNNESGALGWGEGWLLASYVVMYRAYRDTHYLDKIIAHFDQVLKSRDNVRGVKDWRGKSLPSWRCTGRYTTGNLILNDASGSPVLGLRSGARPAEDVRVNVSQGTRQGTFKIIATLAPAKKGAAPVIDEYDNLTMDPRSSDFAPTRINGEFEEVNQPSPRVMLTAYDARPTTEQTSPPKTIDSATMQSMANIFPVQVGQILTPIATFIRIVKETPQLRDDPKYRAKADEYLDAVQSAIDVHDFEWRENKDGEGWLAWVKGAPVLFDGCDQPHNQYLSLGRVMMQVAAVTDDPVRRATYLDRARKMARTLKNDLTQTDDGTFTWTYFWKKGTAYKGWTADEHVSQSQPTMLWPQPGGVKTVEDISHGVLDIDFIRLAFENKLGVFDEDDMRRLARTFSKKILTNSADGSPTTFQRVDGSGSKGAYDIIAGAWVMLAPHDASIFNAVEKMYLARPPGRGASSAMLGIAYLNWYRARYLERD